MKPRRDRPRRAADPVVERRFEGVARLEELLAKSGSLADVKALVAAFQEAHAQGAPAASVIEALWEDEPRFASPADAAALFGNLLGLFELVARGERLELPADDQPRERAPRGPNTTKAPAGEAARRPPPAPPPPFGPSGPDDDFVRQALRFLAEDPRARQRRQHRFEQRHDGLLCAVELLDLSDAGCALARGLAFEAFALLELGGRAVRPMTVGDWQRACQPGSDASQRAGELPAAIERWLRRALDDAAPQTPGGEGGVAPSERSRLEALVDRLVRLLWARSHDAGDRR